MSLCLEGLGLEALVPHVDTWFDIFISDASRYAVTALVVWIALWVVLAIPLRRRKIRPERPAARQLMTEFAFSMRTAFIFSLGGMSMYLMAVAGWLRTDEADALGWAWGLPCLLLMIVAHDAYFYWAHRLLHRSGLFRWTHRRHHRSHNPSPFTAYSFDVAEAVLLVPFVPLWVLLVPTSWSVVALFMLHQIIRNVIGHSGYEIFPARADGRPLFDWMTTVTHHDLHHAQAGWNFGLYFTWWDRWMGTEHPEYYERFAAAAGRWATKPAAATLAAIATLGIGLTMAGSPGQSRAETLGIHGLWATQGFGAIVDIGPCEGAPDKACGRIVWLWEPGPLIGTLILQAFTETAPGIWRGGTVYNPDDGRSYSGSITLTEAGNLKLEGCALGIFCQTQQWRRPRDILQEVARLGL